MEDRKGAFGMGGVSWLCPQSRTLALASSWAWTPARGRPLSRPSGISLLQADPFPDTVSAGPGCFCASECGGVLSSAEMEGTLGTRCAPRSEPVESAWAAGSLSFPEPLQSWLPPQADSRRMVLLRLPRAQAASFPPSLSPGTGWAGLQPWELRRLLFFSSPSKLHSAAQ